MCIDPRWISVFSRENTDVLKTRYELMKKRNLIQKRITLHANKTNVCCRTHIKPLCADILIPSLQHTATHCNTLQHTATHCNTLQHIATHCNSLGRYTCTDWWCQSLCRATTRLMCFLMYVSPPNSRHKRCFVLLSSLQHIASHYNTLQHTATHCDTLQHSATLCNTLQHTATHCNTPQHTATHRNTLQHNVCMKPSAQHP